MICSTNRNPPEAVRSGQLREDFTTGFRPYVEVPPLRERTDDIQLLADYFLKLFSEQYNKQIQGYSQTAISVMYNYRGGNVRSLSAIERAILLSKGDN